MSGNKEQDKKIADLNKEILDLYKEQGKLKAEKEFWRSRAKDIFISYIILVFIFSIIAFVHDCLKH